MNIGIIGQGFVGSAVREGLKNFYNLKTYDVDKEKCTDTHEEICKWADIIFLCVPTPSLPDGSCDTSIVESVISELNQANYNGIVSIKSTVVPGTTKKLNDNTNLEICFVPEFLRERCAVTDFTENHDVCIIGTDSDETFEILKQCHGSFPQKFVKLTPTEAEFCKYFNKR